jgi:translation elongation factor aEF-1 beta
MTAIVKIRIMPLSVETSLVEVRNLAEKSIGKSGGRNARFEEIPIAFGLKALDAVFLWDEGKELEPLEAILGKIKGVKSVELTDIRRAIG